MLVKDKFVMFYLGHEGAAFLLEERTNLLQVGAVADVLEVRAVLHVGNEGTVSLADECRAAPFGEFSSFFVKERAASQGLKEKCYLFICKKP